MRTDKYINGLIRMYRELVKEYNELNEDYEKLLKENKLLKEKLSKKDQWEENI